MKIAFSENFETQRTVESFRDEIWKRFSMIKDEELASIARFYINSDKTVDEVQTALYYLTDEDYANERNLIRFFAKDLEKLSLNGVK
jgi:hypothetical protein